MPLEPPPEGIFATLDELVTQANAHAGHEGYAIVKQRSKKGKDGEDRRVYLACDRGGIYRERGVSFERRQRLVSTRKTNCPFSATATLNTDVWILEVRIAVHNHEPSTSLLSHPAHRKRIPKNIEQIGNWSKTGIPPRRVAASLREEGAVVIAKDISNIKSHIRSKNLGARTPIEAMFQQLQTHDYNYRWRTDDIGHVTHLFFIHPRSLEMLREYPDLLLLDCTYKTNKFKMPLLNIVGVTSLNTTFHAAFCFIRKEENGDYLWALQQLKDCLQAASITSPALMITDRDLALITAIDKIFPTPQTQSILCIWHVNKNVLMKAKEYMQGEDSNTRVEEFMRRWNELVNSITPTEYRSRYYKLFSDFNLTLYPLLSYVDDTWLKPFKDKLIRCWVDGFHHFGNRATSRVEGAHATLKRHLQISTMDLKDVLDRIEIMLKSQHQEFEAKLGTEKIAPGLDLQIPIFTNLLGFITPHALRLILKQYRLLKSDQYKPSCTGLFHSSMGLPCSHMIQAKLQDPGNLRLADIHPHWQFIRPIRQVTMEPLVLNPAVVRPKGRPAGSTNRPREAKSSTRRDPSQFELPLTRRALRSQAIIELDDI
jgi:MULE transposase domain